MSRRVPFRRDNDITQGFNDGVVMICTITDSAEIGLLPEEKLSHKYTLGYAEQRLGINRMYLARENQIKISRVLRVPRLHITTQDIAITEDNIKYRIDSVQSVQDVYPQCLDIALVLYEGSGDL